MAVEIVTRPWMTAAECLAWAERYREVPFNALAMRCAIDKEPGPMHVMASLLRIVTETQPLRPKGT